MAYSYYVLVICSYFVGDHNCIRRSRNRLYGLMIAYFDRRFIAAQMANFGSIGSHASFSVSVNINSNKKVRINSKYVIAVI